MVVGKVKVGDEVVEPVKYIAVGFGEAPCIVKGNNVLFLIIINFEINEIRSIKKIKEAS